MVNKKITVTEEAVAGSNNIFYKILLFYFAKIYFELILFKFN